MINCKSKQIEVYGKNSPITIVNSHVYLAKSKSGERCQHVIRKKLHSDVWVCTCTNFKRRLARCSDDKLCKHIVEARVLYKTIQYNFDRYGENQDSIDAQKDACQRCWSPKIKKTGFRTLKSGEKRQRYTCLKCMYRFVLNKNGFRKVKNNPELIVEALNLWMCGMSLRDIARHFRETRQIRIGYSTIAFWFKKYTKLVKQYVDQITVPQQKEGLWSVDEMMINVRNTSKTGKGFYDWLWTIIDPSTRFIIASEISKNRKIIDAQRILSEGRKKTQFDPHYIITDSLRSYENAIKNEFGLQTVEHVKTKSFSDGFENRPIERYHNEVRAVTKTKRGLDNDNSSQEFADGYRIYHNFVRPHSGIGNKTPAEAAGIDLNLGENKLKNLIAKSTQYKYDFEKQLRKRIQYVKIVNEEDCTRVIPKTWINKNVWREINDILRLNGFVWLTNVKGGCWIR